MLVLFVVLGTNVYILGFFITVPTLSFKYLYTSILSTTLYIAKGNSKIKRT